MSALLAELHALWTEVFGEPPSVNADAKMLSELLVRHLPRAPPYGEPSKPGNAGPVAEPRQEGPADEAG